MATTHGASEFAKVFGRPAPKAKPGLQFDAPAMQYIWERMHPRVGVGWFRNRFIYLFGEGLADLLPCLDAWSFLVPRQRKPVIFGRNAFGALLVMPDSTLTATEPTVGLLDPSRVSWTSNPNLGLGNLIEVWLPEGRMPAFTDDELYRGWLSAGGQAAPIDQMLAPKIALALGGSTDSKNLELQDIVSYYAITGPIYENAGLPKGRGPR